MDIIYKNKENRKKSIDLIKENIENNNNIRERLISIESVDVNNKSEEISNNNILNNKKNLISLNSYNDSIIFYEKLNLLIGNIKLIKSFAGHNGMLKPDEKDYYYEYLLKGNFIN